MASKTAIVPYVPKKTHNKKKDMMTSSSFAAAVKKVIAAREETKFANIISQVNTINSGPIDQTATSGGYVTTNCMPNQIIGSGPQSRIGNEIYPTSLRFKYTLYFSIGFPTIFDIPQEVYVMAVSLKNLAGASALQTLTQTDMTQLVNSGLGNSLWTGQPFNASLPLNSDYFTVHSRRKHKMCNFIQVPTSGGVLQPYNTSSYNCIVNGNLKIRPPKKLIFNDGQTNLPVNFSYFVIVGFVPVTGAGGVNGTRTALTIDWSSQLYYKET